METHATGPQSHTRSGGFVARARISLAGLGAGLRSDRSIRELWLVSIASGFALCIANPAPLWWALAVVAGSSAVAIEYLNAALEAALDKLHPDLHPAIGVAKDLASGAAFVANVGALCVVALALYSA